jgi:hypothetical protein
VDVTEDGDEGRHRRLALVSNEFAAVEIDLDEGDANGPRVRIHSVRDDEEVWLDPHSLSLVAHVDADVLGLLADIARDGRAREELSQWLQSRREKLVVPDELHDEGR